MNYPNWSQIQGVLDRAILIALTYAASKGWITPTEIAGLVTLIVGVLGSIYAFYINTYKNLAKEASTIPNTTILTTPEIAKATPDQTNIISTAENTIVVK